jgi:hypothetical protein
MKRPAYDSPALPITWNRLEYSEGQNEYVPIKPDYKKQIDELYRQGEQQSISTNNPEVLIDIQKEFGENPYELKNILKYWIRNPKEELHVIPTDSIVIKIDKEAVRRSGMKIPDALGDSIPDYMHISLKDKRGLYKSELMMLEMLSNANWERPIYMAITVGGENRLNMDGHFVQEGLTYRFTPFETAKLGATIDSEKMYDNLMNKFKFGGINQPGIYLDENVLKMCYTHRRIFAQLINQLLVEGEREKAAKALAYCKEMIPDFNVPYDFQNGASQLAEAYYKLDNRKEGDRVTKALADKSVEYLTWYLKLNDKRVALSMREIQYHIAILDEEVKMMKKYKSPAVGVYEKKLDQLYDVYVSRVHVKQ